MIKSPKEGKTYSVRIHAEKRHWFKVHKTHITEELQAEDRTEAFFYAELLAGMAQRHFQSMKIFVEDIREV